MYVISAASVFFVLGLAWRNSNWFNFLLRIGMFAMAFWGGYLFVKG